MKYRLIVILIFGVLIVLSCSSKHIAVPDKSEQQRLAFMMEALEDFISDTPYCALIQHTSVDVVPIPDLYPDDDDVEEKHIYHAIVLETFRGQQLENISYITITEKGESATISTEPVVVTLCYGKAGFWGLGTGSVYPATKTVIQAARRIGQKFKFVKQSFPDCE